MNANGHFPIEAMKISILQFGLKVIIFLYSTEVYCFTTLMHVLYLFLASVEWDESWINGTPSKLIVWYNNKGYHALPSYINTIHNAMFRSIMENSDQESEKYGITTFSHPLRDSLNQFDTTEL